MEEALSPQPPAFPTGTASLRAQEWGQPCGLQLPAGLRLTGLAAGRSRSITQGSAGMRDAAQDGSGVDIGASHHPACSVMAPLFSHQ